MEDLNDKQRLFAEHYVACLNATEAAARAGYEGDRKSLAVIGSENLRKLKIRAYIDQLMTEQAMGRAEILGRLAEHARGSIADFLTVDGNGQLTGFDLSPEQPLHLIKKASLTETEFNGVRKKQVTIELYDQHAALVKLGEHLRLWGKNVNLNIDLSVFTDAELDAIDAGADPIEVLAKRGRGEATS